jgi:hypothetical protein
LPTTCGAPTRMSARPAQPCAVPPAGTGCACLQHEECLGYWARDSGHSRVPLPRP